ncbi:MAG: metallophosphoesterase family protein [Promethearchaeota archaeon]|jgi:putative phosphoesterase
MKIDDVKKIAIVADIHANKYALARFLNFIDKNIKVDYILNLGDFLQIGPHPKEVTEIVLSDKRFINILGNNEIVITEHVIVETPEGELMHRTWTKEQLDPAQLEKVQEIPMSRTLDINNTKFFMIHSRQIKNDLKNTWGSPLLYQEKPLNEFIEDYPANVDFILFGHTHEQFYLNWKNKAFINPGSLGCSILRSTVSFCIIEANAKNWNICFKNLTYDESKLKSDYIKSDVPDRKYILSNFYGIEI